MRRREFIKIMPWIFPAGIAACRKLTDPSGPDLILTGDPQMDADLARRQFVALQSMAEKPGREISVGLAGNDGAANEVLTLAFAQNQAAGYPHLRITRQNGEVANLVWGTKYLLPSIRFADDNGGTLKGRDGEELEFGLSDVFGRSAKPAFARDWLSTGIKIAAVAFAAWLGLSVSGYILAALAFLAFNAMVLGLLIVAVAAISPFLKGILSTTGWTTDDVRSFFTQTASNLMSFFQEVADFVQNR